MRLGAVFGGVVVGLLALAIIASIPLALSTQQLREGCARRKLQNASDATEQRIGAEANWTVAKDPRQPKITQDARAKQARFQTANSRRLTRRSRENCRELYPFPPF